jgi:hypothetical protein
LAIGPISAALLAIGYGLAGLMAVVIIFFPGEFTGTGHSIFSRGHLGIRSRRRVAQMARNNIDKKGSHWRI